MDKARMRRRWLDLGYWFGKNSWLNNWTGFQRYINAMALGKELDWILLPVYVTTAWGQGCIVLRFTCTMDQGFVNRVYDGVYRERNWRTHIGVGCL